ncbi:MAG TPA: HigA family addiction module antitoxin [Williamwhitmania sp.]|nr:HigA family addiction module antitoxin [Williamwhitmania sp.]
MNSSALIPAISTHPGEVLKDELDSRNIKQKEFAHDIGTSPTILNEILKGKRNITADIALHLEAQLEIPADFWMKLQSQYDIDLARIKQRNIEKRNLIETWKAIKVAIPVKYLEKLNLLANDLKNDIDRIKEIYNANSLEDIIDAKTAYTGLYRKSSKLQVDVNNLTCWAMVCRWMAQNKKAATYNASNLSAVKQRIIEIVNKNHNVIDEVTQLLYDYGIKFIILEKPDQTPVDGFSFFSGLNPVIAITLRKKTIDNFSFTVLHELGHIQDHLRPNSTSFFIDCFDLQESKKDTNEAQADRYAQQALIPPAVWATFSLSKNIFNDLYIQQFAQEHNLNPAIVLGRYSFETNNYKVRTTIDRGIN